MKKIFLISVIAFVSLGVSFAQNQYKLNKGNVTTELQFSLLNISTWKGNSGNFNMPGLRLRYAITDRWAFRSTLDLDFGHQSNKISPYENNPNVWGAITSSSNSTNFSILPGFEYHFGKWERVSIYVGGELLFGIKTTKSTYNSNIGYYNYYGGMQYTVQETVDLTVKNCNYYYDSWSQDAFIREPNGNMAFGVNAFTGIDIYV